MTILVQSLVRCFLFFLSLAGLGALVFLLALGYKKYQEYLGEKFTANPRVKLTPMMVIGDIFTQQRVLAISRWLLVGSIGFLVYALFLDKIRITTMPLVHYFVANPPKDGEILLWMWVDLIILGQIIGQPWVPLEELKKKWWICHGRAIINLIVSVLVAIGPVFGVLQVTAFFFLLPWILLVVFVSYFLIVYSIKTIKVSARYLVRYLKGEEI